MKNNQQRPLSESDSETQTLGCRHSNPDICRNNMTPGKCAFARQDGMCLVPPLSWPKIYQRLVDGVEYYKPRTKQRTQKNAGR